jgi:hypothetical protein
VLGLILGLGLTPDSFTPAVRAAKQVSGLFGAPTDQPMSPPTSAIQPAPRSPAPQDGGEADRVSPSILSTPPAAPRPAPGSAKIAPPAGGPLTVGVFGDSLADGLWAGLYRQMHAGKGVQVIKFSQPATGLSRYDYVNVQARTEGQLADRHVDVAVILFGTNDQQGIVEGGKVYPFGDPGWRDVYGRRIDALVATLRRQGAVVYWVGLPKMRAAGFDGRAATLNALYQQHMAALGVRFIPTDGATEDAQGAYAAYLPDEVSGRMTLMRANDGMHMTMPGYLRIAAPVAASIRADRAQTVAAR